MRRLKEPLTTKYLQQRYGDEIKPVEIKPKPICMNPDVFNTNEVMKQAYFAHLDRSMKTFWWTQASDKEKQEFKQRLRRLYC